MKLKRKPRLNQKGQTATEYLLLLLVMVSVITSLLSYIKGKYIGDITRCSQSPNSETMLCKINNLMEPGGGGAGKKFQFYHFK